MTPWSKGGRADRVVPPDAGRRGAPLAQPVVKSVEVRHLQLLDPASQKASEGLVGERHWSVIGLIDQTCHRPLTRLNQPARLSPLRWRTASSPKILPVSLAQTSVPGGNLL